MKSKIAFTLMRILLGLVFLLFGIGKFQNDIWAQTIKTMAILQKLPWDINVSLFLIGTSEVLIGAALIGGIFTRLFAGLAALELIVILIFLKFQEVRDIGLFGAALYMALAKVDSFNIIGLWKKREELKR